MMAGISAIIHALPADGGQLGIYKIADRNQKLDYVHDEILLHGSAIYCYCLHLTCALFD
jgi:hypothetical protein